MKTDAENSEGLLERLVLNVQLGFREKRMITALALLKDLSVALCLQMLAFVVVLG